MEAMKERHLISPTLIANKHKGAVFINGDESFSFMVHEEDVLREQGVARGLKLEEIQAANGLDSTCPSGTTSEPAPTPTT